MKHHNPQFHTGTHGVTLRGCHNCSQTWVLVHHGEGAYWVPVEEHDENGHTLVSKDVLECQGDVTQVRGKTAVTERDSTSTRGNNLCYCRECNGKVPHFPEARNCYCKSCGGKRKHNG